MDLKPVIRWLENGCDPKEAARELRLCQGKTGKPKIEKLGAAGLRKNPCQGCEVYYTRAGLYGQCVIETEGGCGWIRVYDNALAV